MTELETPFRYDAAFADGLERKWQAWWEERRSFQARNPGEPGFDATKPKFYVLDMFPYPSGAGLHVGHPVGYIGTDIVARAKRMKGFNVLHPMGWDAFGLPAEQYAVQTGVHPRLTTSAAIKTFRQQLKRFGFSYDWSREFATIDPDYVRFTQWIWLQCWNAWYDEKARRARPIEELKKEFESGARRVELANKATKLWNDCTPGERREAIDAKRLTYLGEQLVNWCPKLGTVLANEEVVDGKSERGGFPVMRKPLKQWMFRITAYAERLLNDLKLVEWPESTRTQQAEWIGRSEGAEIHFKVRAAGGASSSANAKTPAGNAAVFPDLTVFTTRPDTLFGATYMVVAPEHPLVKLASAHAGGAAQQEIVAYVEAARHRSDIDRQSEGKAKTGVFTGLCAVNPATGEDIQIWTADYVLMNYGTGAIMAVPAHDQRDFEFARAFKLPMRTVVIAPSVVPAEDGAAYGGEGIATSSSNAEVSLDGLATAQAKEKIIAWLETKGLGRKRVNFRLRDWLFSRQRYWGEPFPVVFDPQGMPFAISEKALPVRLPELEDFKPTESETPRPLLGKAAEWIRTTAGAAGVSAEDLPPETPVTREANTMPNWAGSCWYYLRYCDPKNTKRFVSPEAEKYWMGKQGVDLYVGGSEHAVLHLLYARFWHKVLFDLGHVSTPEPFARLFHQGLITSFAYQRDDGTLVAADAVEESGEGKFLEKATKKPVKQVVAKMSKSLKNVVNPDDVIANFGADTFRLYEMSMGPLEASKPWNTRDIAGSFRFLQRAWRLAVDEHTGELLLAAEADPAIEKLLHRATKKVGEDIDRLAFNTAIAALIEVVNAATRSTSSSNAPQGGLTRDQLIRFVKLLAPFAPHFCEEIWSKLGEREALACAPWPAFDAALLVDDEVELAVQLSGKVKTHLRVPSSADAASIERMALAEPKILELLAGRAPKKIIIVPGRLINIVA
ncbi:MAG: leucine--tRNA ligase [Planctomycetes bacterium]|nr:leucine--tRNA ligase [Planctomycetota bacterium]